jgi:hypothetical protein
MAETLPTEYQCEKCGHIKVKKTSLSYKLIRSFLLAISAIFMAFGMLFLIVSVTAMTSEPYGSNGLFTKISGLMYSLSADRDNLQVREYLINNVPGLSDCHMDQVCYADRIFEYLSNNTYYLTGAQLYPATYTLSNRDVQCSNYAFTYCYSLKQFGIPCEIRCGGRHCWNEMTIDGVHYLYDATAGIKMSSEDSTIDESQKYIDNLSVINI